MNRSPLQKLVESEVKNRRLENICGVIYFEAGAFEPMVHDGSPPTREPRPLLPPHPHAVGFTVADKDGTILVHAEHVFEFGPGRGTATT